VISNWYFNRFLNNVLPRGNLGKLILNFQAHYFPYPYFCDGLVKFDIYYNYTSRIFYLFVLIILPLGFFGNAEYVDYIEYC